MRASRLLLGLLPIVAMTLPGPGSAQQDATLELRVRAAFLYNFARYTHWPSQPDAAVFRFCLADSAQLLPVLQKTVADKLINDRPIEVHVTAPSESAGICQLLYLGPNTDLARWQQQLESREQILIVGEGQEMAQQGGMIGFYMHDGRLRFAINPDRVDRTGLQISSQLLSLATIVRSVGP